MKTILRTFAIVILLQVLSSAHAAPPKTPPAGLWNASIVAGQRRRMDRC